MSSLVEQKIAHRPARQLDGSKLPRSLLLGLVAVTALPLLVLAGVQVSNISAHAARTQATPLELYYGLTYPGAPDIPTLSNYETQIGKRASLVMWYEFWEQGDSQAANQLQPFPAAQMEAVREHGAIPVLSWNPGLYPVPSDDNEPDFSLARIAGGAWDDYIRQYALEVKAWGHPFFLRFAGEMNGNWEFYSEFHSGNSVGQFVQAWRHVHDIFTSVGATNASWVWCPNIESTYSTPLEDDYPGNAYVDWAGLDGYNFSVNLDNSPWLSFSQLFTQTYDHLLQLIPPTMPIMIGETGSVEDGGSKAAWITDALTTQLPRNFPRIKALVWYDESAGPNLDIGIDTSPASLAAFQAAVSAQTYQSNRYSTLDQSPIPAPEQVVLPTPTPAPTRVPRPRAGPSPSGAPLSVNFLAGPSPGTVEVTSVPENAPVARASLLYQDGVLARSNSNGVSRIPSRVSLRSPAQPVLQQIAAGKVVISMHIALNQQYGYQIGIDLITRKVIWIVVHVSVDLRPLVVQIALLMPMVIIVCSVLFRRVTRRRRGRRKAAKAKVQLMTAGYR